jgi:predicted XRE-type DNA-binding protein
MRRTLAGQSKERVNEAGSNLFADFGIHEATEKNTKVQLAVALNEIIEAKGLKQRAVAGLLHCTQPDVSMLQNYKLASFSIERMIDFALALDNDIEITIRPTGRDHSKHHAHTSVKIEKAA